MLVLHPSLTSFSDAAFYNLSNWILYNHEPENICFIFFLWLEHRLIPFHIHQSSATSGINLYFSNCPVYLDTLKLIETNLQTCITVARYFLSLVDLILSGCCKPGHLCVTSLMAMHPSKGVPASLKRKRSKCFFL